jgi:hypothetical protein
MVPTLKFIQYAPRFASRSLALAAGVAPGAAVHDGDLIETRSRAGQVRGAQPIRTAQVRRRAAVILLEVCYLFPFVKRLALKRLMPSRVQCDDDGLSLIGKLVCGDVHDEIAPLQPGMRVVIAHPQNIRKTCMSVFLQEFCEQKYGVAACAMRKISKCNWQSCTGTALDRMAKLHSKSSNVNKRPVIILATHQSSPEFAKVIMSLLLQLCDRIPKKLNLLLQSSDGGGLGQRPFKPGNNLAVRRSGVCFRQSS